MADNDWKSRLGMVYSTNPDFEYRTDEPEEAETLPAARQQLRVWLDRRQRAGKVVTIVRGFVGREADLAELARLLKTRCGVGGAAKEGRSSSRATTATASSRYSPRPVTAARKRDRRVETRRLKRGWLLAVLLTACLAAGCSAPRRSTIPGVRTLR